MNVGIENDIATVLLPIASTKGGFHEQLFQIDTGFQGAVVFIGGEILKRNILIDNLHELPAKEWVTVADGRQVRTFGGVAWLDFSGERESVDVFIIEAVKSDTPLIGLQFLRENRKHLSLDFKSDTHFIN